MVSLVEVTKAAVVAGGSAILLLRLSWWVPAVLATGYVMMTVWGTRLQESGEEAAEAATGLRRAQYLREQAFEPASGREARLFGLADWFRIRSDQQWQAAMRHVWDDRSATRGTAIITIAALIGSHLLVFAYIMQSAFQGLIGVTGAALFLQAAGGMVNLWLPWHVVALREATRPVRSLETLLFHQARQSADEQPETSARRSRWPPMRRDDRSSSTASRTPIRAVPNPSSPDSTFGSPPGRRSRSSGPTERARPRS